MLATLRAAIVNSLPEPVIDFIQVVSSVGVTYLIAWLTSLTGHLNSPWLIVYGAAVGLYYSAVSAAEKRWPTWAWLFYLLPTDLPD
jgi:hypothetical protein